MFQADDPDSRRRAREGNLLGMALDFTKQAEAMLRRVEPTEDLDDVQQQLASLAKRIDSRRREFIDA